MSELIVLMGIPGAGKSTWVKDHADVHEVVCPDKIREELTGDTTNQSQNAQVFETAHARVQAWGLGQNLPVIFDATNVTAKARATLLDIAARNPGTTTRLVVFTDTGAAFERNMQRDRVVPMKAMFKMANNFQESLSQIAREDWDVIEFVRT